MTELKAAELVPLRLDPQPSPLVVVDQDYPLFADTAWSKRAFKITARRMSRAEWSELRKRFIKRDNRGSERVDETAFSSAVFVEAIDSWDIIDSRSNAPLACNQENKSLLANAYGTLVAAVVQAVLADPLEREGAADEAKN